MTNKQLSCLAAGLAKTGVLLCLCSCASDSGGKAAYVATPASPAESGDLAPTPDYTPFAVPNPVPTPLPMQTAEQKERDRKQQATTNARLLAALPAVAVGKPRLVKQWDSLPMVFSLEFPPDGRLLALGGNVNNAGSGADLRSTKDWQSKGNFPGSTIFAWSPDSRRFAIVNEGVDIWDVRDYKIISTLADGSGMDGAGNKGGAGVFGPLIFSADGSKITTLGEDPNSRWKLMENDTNTEASSARQIAIKVWNVSDGKRLKVQPGPWSRGTNNLARISNSPTEIGFAAISAGSSVASNAQPPIYLTTNSPDRRFFGRRSTPQFPYATLSIPRRINVGGFAIAGNAWIYSVISIADTGGSTIRIFRTRDQRLMRSLKLSSARRITDIAISPDSKTLVVAQDHPEEEMINDATYGLIRREVSQSRVLIYQLDTRKS